MSFFPFGTPPALRDLKPDLYEPGSPAATLAAALAPLIEAEREQRRNAEKLARELRKGKAEPAHAGGLLGPGLLSLDSFIADSLPWHDIAKDMDALLKFSQALGVSLGTLAQAIAQLLAPPNWELFFWMGRALDSVSADEALRWKGEADAARAEAEALKQKAVARSRKGTDGLWGREGGPRAQRQWWESAWASAKAQTPGLTKKAFVGQQWAAYLATRPRPLVERETVQTKWLRGK